MDKIDISKFKGQNLNYVISEAEKLEYESLEGKINAHKLYTECLKNVSSDYNKFQYSLRGVLREKIWNIERYFGWNNEFFSQAGQDKFIDEKFFSNKSSGGFFLEIGAYDGKTGSNCFYFEKFKKWQGIAIEPSNQQFVLLNKNRNCSLINKAISNKNGTHKFYEVREGLTQVSGLDENYYQKKYNKIKKDKNTVIKEIMVKTITLDSLISEYTIKEIDYCSIDVEGGEFSIIENFDFSKCLIKVISLENSETDKTHYNSILEKHGYQFLDCVGDDEIWFKKNYFNFK